MSLTEADPSKTLETLSTTVDQLEATLAPLLASRTSLTDLFAQLETQGTALSPIERAHARIMLAYTVHDLIWVYLRICAINPATHPVMAELTRLKNYFSKLHRAEPSILQTNQPQTELEAGPSTMSINDNVQRTNLDINAATRFINAVIGGKKNLDPKGKHTRFDGEEGEEENGSSSSASSEQEVAKSLGKKEGKSEAKKQVKKVPMGRPKMDPFMGFDDQTTSSKPNQKEAKLKRKSVEATPTTTSSEGKKKRKRALSVSDVEPTSTSTSAAPLSKHQKKTLRLKAGGGLPGEGAGSGSKDGEGKTRSPKKVKKATKE